MNHPTSGTLRRPAKLLLLLLLAGCMSGLPALATSLPVSPETSDDKCPDGSKKDPELGCRQTTRVKGEHSTFGEKAGYKRAKKSASDADMAKSEKSAKEASEKEAQTASSDTSSDKTSATKASSTEKSGKRDSVFSKGKSAKKDKAPSPKD